MDNPVLRRGPDKRVPPTGGRDKRVHPRGDWEGHVYHARSEGHACHARRSLHRHEERPQVCDRQQISMS